MSFEDEVLAEWGSPVPRVGGVGGAVLQGKGSDQICRNDPELNTSR